MIYSRNVTYVGLIIFAKILINGKIYLYYEGDIMSKIDELKRIINESSNIVFFGGAGVSTESGIKDFRGKNGLYKQKLDKPTEYYLSSDCFFNDTENFFKFYNLHSFVLFLVKITSLFICGSFLHVVVKRISFID